jgi:hypothetical protein
LTPGTVIRNKRDEFITLDGSQAVRPAPIRPGNRQVWREAPCLLGNSHLEDHKLKNRGFMHMEDKIEHSI